MKDYNIGYIVNKQKDTISLLLCDKKGITANVLESVRIPYNSTPQKIINTINELLKDYEIKEKGERGKK